MSETKTTALSTYGTTDLAAVRQARAQVAEERASRGADRMKLVEGKNVIRVMPPWSPSQRTPFYESWVHYLRNPAEPGANGKPVLCPLKMKRAASCVVCAKVSALYRTGSKADEKEAKDMRSNRRVYINVVNMQEPDKGVIVLEFGAKLYDDFTALMAGQDADDPSALGDISHPDTGYNLVIVRTGTGMLDTRYELRAARAPSPIAKREWLTQLHDLSKMIAERDSEYVQALMEGRAPQDAAPQASAQGKPASAAGGVPKDEFGDDLF